MTQLVLSYGDHNRLTSGVHEKINAVFLGVMLETGNGNACCLFIASAQRNTQVFVALVYMLFKIRENNMKTQKATYLKVSMSEYRCFTGATE